jgi:hypothetical protein
VDRHVLGEVPPHCLETWPHKSQLQKNPAENSDLVVGRMAVHKNLFRRNTFSQTLCYISWLNIIGRNH